jgi:NAD(P)H:quinone oxidoreductase type IV
MFTRIQVVFYSMYGHIHKMAEAVAAGARAIEGTEVALLQVPELIADDVRLLSGARDTRAAFAAVPYAVPAKLAEADAIIFGTPTRFGNMCAQMRNFLDQTGPLWMNGGLIGKVGSVFTSAASQHGGLETTITSFHSTPLHHGMVVVGVPYSQQKLLDMDRIEGGSPYGAATITRGDGTRQPSATELEIARFQGMHVADIARRLTGGHWAR